MPTQTSLARRPGRFPQVLSFLMKQNTYESLEQSKQTRWVRDHRYGMKWAYRKFDPVWL